MPRKPTDKSKQPVEQHVMEAMLYGSSGSILAQEAAGQREMLFSDVLPVDLDGGKIEDYEMLGFAFGPSDRDDPLFRLATLPEGWSRQGSSHSMWSYIVDEQGRRRVAIFYKAVFYDRRAFMRIECP